MDSADRLDILEVLAATNRAADEKDVPATKAHYEPDGHIEGDMQAPAGDGFAEALQGIYDNEPGLKRHVGTNHIFEQQGEEVLVRSLLVVFDGEDEPGVVATADIEDVLRKAGGSWKITRHKVTMDPATKKAMGLA